MNTIIVDENTQSRNLTYNILNNLPNIKITGNFDNFSQVINYDTLNLIIFDINSNNSSEILAKIKTLKLEYYNLNFIATSYEINSQLVNQALKIGVNDFILKPILPTILETSIKKLNLTKTKKAKTISVFSNKGGVGKT